MIYEFAVNPSLCAEWTYLRMLCNDFGKEQGRLISDVPRKKWLTLARDAIDNANLTTMKTKTLKEYLIKLKKSALYIRNQTFNGEEHWITNAIHTHEIWPFKAILTDEYSGENDVIIPNDIKLVENTHWRVPPSVTVNRTPSDMISAIKPMLEKAKEVMMVDRNFKLEDQRSRHSRHIIRFKTVLIKILNVLSNKEFGHSVGKVIYHIGDKYSKDELERQCNLYIKDEIPIGMKIEFVLWPWNELHDRFVLTDIGGVDFGQGLDESTRDGTETVKISRLSIGVYKDWWRLCKQKKMSFVILNPHKKNFITSK